MTRRTGQQGWIMLCIGLTVAFATSAAAQTEDVIGVYFDSSATTNAVTTSAPYQVVTAYLLLVNPSATAGVSGWECECDVVGPGLLGGNWTLNGTAMNVQTPPQFNVGLGTGAAALPWAPAILLATHIAVVSAPSAEVEYYLHAGNPASLEDPPYSGNDVPCYADGADPTILRRLHLPVACETSPVATVNGDTATTTLVPALTPSTLDLGTLERPGITTSDHQLRIENTTGALLSGRIRATEPGLRFRFGAMGWSNELPFTLAQGLTMAVLVHYTGSAYGVFTPSLELVYCDRVAARVPCSVTVGEAKCTGYASVTGFGSVRAGTTVVADLRLVNDGYFTYHGTLGVDGAGFDLSGYDGDAQITLDPGQVQHYAYTFTPPMPGVLYVGCIRIGTGCIQVFGRSAAENDVVPATLDFGAVTAGSMSQRTFVIRNHFAPYPLTGTIRRQAGYFTLLAGAGAQYSFSTVDSLVLTVEFRPQGATVCRDTLKMTGTSRDLICTGSTAGAACSLSPTALAFGALPVGLVTTRTLTIRNDGVGTLSGTVGSLATPFGVVSGGGAFSLPAGYTRTVTVRYAPTTLGDHSAALDTGCPVCGLVPCSGRGTEAAPVCSLSPTSLDFGPVLVGTSASRVLVVANNGYGTLTCTVGELPPPFRVTSGGGTFSLSQGYNRNISVQYSPVAPGTYSAELDLGCAGCASVSLTGSTVGPLPDHDLIGVWIDAGGTTNELTTDGMDPVTAYLVLKAPSATTGIGSWEGTVYVMQNWYPQSFTSTLAGGGVNNEAWPSFRVNLPTPLAASEAVVLATLRIPLLNTGVADIYLAPLADPALAGALSYTPGNDTGSHVPLTIASGAASLPVARIYYLGSPVGVLAGAPQLGRTNGGISLTWNAGRTAADAVHVYRQAGSASPVRLTPMPLTVSDGHVTYVDPAGGIASGTHLRYSLGLLRGGQEVARTPETAITLTAIAPDATVLRSAFPNPFNPETTIAFDLARGAHARLEVFDCSGRRIRTLADEDLGAGSYTRTWDGRDAAGRPVPSGVYYCRLSAGGAPGMRKLMLLR